MEGGHTQLGETNQLGHTLACHHKASAVELRWLPGSPGTPEGGQQATVLQLLLRGEDVGEDDRPASLHEAFQPVAMMDEQRRIRHGGRYNGDSGGGGGTARVGIHEDGQ